MAQIVKTIIVVKVSVMIGKTEPMSNSITDAHVKGIPPTQPMTLLFKPLSGILKQRY